MPFGVETLRPWGLLARGFFRVMSKKLFDDTRVWRAVSYFDQRISIDIQGNIAASLLGMLSSDRAALHNVKNSTFLKIFKIG